MIQKEKSRFGKIIASVLDESLYEYVANYEGLPSGSKGSAITYS
jgi:hypothetical protein